LVVALIGLAGCGVGAHFGAGAAYDAADRAIRQEKYPEARSYLPICRWVWPYAPGPHLLAARIHRLKGEYAEADAELAACNRLLGRANDATQTEALLVRVQRGDNEFDTIVAGLKNAVANHHPESTFIYDAVTIAYMHQLRFQSALAVLNEWLQREPDNVRALDGRGWVEANLDQRDAALRDYQRALKLEPGRSAVRIRLAQMYLDQNDPMEAWPHLELVAKTMPESPEVLVALARCRVLMGDGDGARRVFDQALAVQSDYSDALLHRGKLESQTGHYVEAEDFLRRALKADPFETETHFALYNCLHAQPDREAEAAEQLTKYETIRSDNTRLSFLLNHLTDAAYEKPEVAWELGGLFLRLGRESSGRDWWFKALRLNPNHKPTLRSLMEYYDKKGDPKEAERYRRQLAQVEASSPP
jgi:tetratricopeptide (TPR) repeat protein